MQLFPKPGYSSAADLSLKVRRIAAIFLSVLILTSSFAPLPATAQAQSVKTASVRSDIGHSEKKIDTKNDASPSNRTAKNDASPSSKTVVVKNDASPTSKTAVVKNNASIKNTAVTKNDAARTEKAKNDSTSTAKSAQTKTEIGTASHGSEVEKLLPKRDHLEKVLDQITASPVKTEKASSNADVKTPQPRINIRNAQAKAAAKRAQARKDILKTQARTELRRAQSRLPETGSAEPSPDPTRALQSENDPFAHGMPPVAPHRKKPADSAGVPRQAEHVHPAKDRITRTGEEHIRAGEDRAHPPGADRPRASEDDRIARPGEDRTRGSEERIARPGEERARQSEPHIAKPGEDSNRIARPAADAMYSGSGPGPDRISRPGDPYHVGKPGDYIYPPTPNQATVGGRTPDNGHLNGTGSPGASTSSAATNNAGSTKSSAGKSTAAGSATQIPKTAPSLTKKPVSPPASTPATAGGATGAPSTSSATDMYPALGKLEKLTFGASKPELAIEDRLVSLENAVFAKTYPNDSLFDRTERLKVTLLGKSAAEPPPGTQGVVEPPSGYVDNPMAANSPDAAELMYLDEIVDNPENYRKAPKVVLDGFALELINYERQRRALGPLEPNSLVQKMADEHTADLIERGVVSHNNSKGENPDKRYTLLGGVDAVNENLEVMSATDAGSSRPCKAVIAKVLKHMLMQQDDREALLAPEASHLGISMVSMAQGASILTCIEVLTNRGVLEPVPKTAHIGEKIEVAGVINAPYQFDRVTLAWEGVSDLPPQEENASEPLPYFPPLDFVAYKEKSERDHSKAIFALKTVGMLAAIAGGMFVPPVALAAPLIMMSGPDPGEPKPVSDVPIKGGVKVSGNAFNGKVSVSNEGKEGLYYLTVWANLGSDDKSVAISRRTILVKQVHDEEEVKGDVSIPKQAQTDSSKSKSGNGDTSKSSSGQGSPMDSKLDQNGAKSKPIDSSQSQPKQEDVSVLKSDSSMPVTSQDAPTSNLKPVDSQSGISKSMSTSNNPFEIGSSEDPFAPAKSQSTDSGKKADAAKSPGKEATAESLATPRQAEQQITSDKRDSAPIQYTKEGSGNVGKDETSNSGKQTNDSAKLQHESADGKTAPLD